MSAGEIFKVGEMTYNVLGLGPLDYMPCRYGACRLTFRGPQRELTGPYLAFIGATETYGKFIAAPFPSLVERVLGIPCINLGQMNAGIDVFCREPFVLEAASNAKVTVVQILGAHNMTNRYYAVHPRRNDRFVAASGLLRSLYDEMDFADFHFTRHLLGQLQAQGPERFLAVQRELQDAWVARMRLMLQQIRGQTVLLWLSTQPPRDGDALFAPGIGDDPVMISRSMIDQISPYASHVVEVIVSEQARNMGTRDMIFHPLEEPAAASMLGPAAHQEVADALNALLVQL